MRQQTLVLLATLLAGCGETTGTQSSVASLSGLTISAGALTPAFSATGYTYSAAVASSVSSITVTPRATDANSTIRVRGSVVASGDASPPQVLTGGPNLIDVVVTAQDGSLLIYDITVTRQ